MSVPLIDEIVFNYLTSLMDVLKTSRIILFLVANLCEGSGQGTVALEFLEQVPQLDVIVVPISGE